MTSKKCWVIGQNKGQGRRQEQQMEEGQGHSSGGFLGEADGGHFMFPPVGQVYSQPVAAPSPGTWGPGSSPS